MMSNGFRRGLSVIALGGFLATTFARSALAAEDEDETKAACGASYEKSQELRSKGKLSEAKEQLLVCAQDACPSFVRTDCVQWLSEVQHDVPTIVIDAKDKNGEDTVAVSVTIDGTVVSKSLDGKALSLDPGVHHLRFELEGADPIEQQLVIRQGQKDRVVSVSFAKAPPEVPEDANPYGGALPEQEADQGASKASKLRIPAYIAGGVGAAGFVGFAVLGAMGKSAKSDLNASGCKPNCAEDLVDSIKTKYVLADVFLGVGIAGLGTGVALFVLSLPKKSKPEHASRAPTFDVNVAPGLTLATVSGRF